MANYSSLADLETELQNSSGVPLAIIQSIKNLEGMNNDNRYACVLYENKNNFKTILPESYADDSYEVKFRYIDKTDDHPCYCDCEMKFEYQHPTNKKKYKITKKVCYNTSSPFALFLCNWDDVWDEHSEDEDEL
jgi:hypothetical protein